MGAQAYLGNPDVLGKKITSSNFILLEFDFFHLICGGNYPQKVRKSPQKVRK